MKASRFVRGTGNVSRRKKKGSEFFYLLTVAVVLVLPMLVIAAKQSKLVNVGYRISEIHDQNAKLRQERARLRAELASLQRPDLILKQIVGMGLTPVPGNRIFEVQLLDLATETDETLLASLNPEP